MTLVIRLTAAMTGLVVLTAAAIGLIAYRNIEAPILLAGLAAVAGILVVAVVLARTLAGIAADGAIGAGSGAFGFVTAGLRDKTAALIHEGHNRRIIESALNQFGQRERAFSAAIESASHPIIAKTLDGTITAWNPAAERLYEYKSAEAIGSHIDIIIPPDRRDEHVAILERFLTHGTVEDFETIRAAKGGRRIDVSLSIRPIKSSPGEIVGVASITRDITAQKFAEEKFRLAVESCPSGMVMIDRSGKVILVNTEIERLFGYGRDELIGQSVDILVPTRLRSQHAQYREDFTRKIATHRKGAGRELSGLRKDGTEFPVEVVLNPIRTGEGPLVLGVIVDISERKRLERLKDEFISTVSHELRTPLTSISGSLGLLIGGATGKLSDPAERLLTIAQANSQRLVRLVNDILDIEKMESNQVPFNFKRVEARTLVEQAIEGNRGFADGYGVRIRMDPASTAGEVHADPDRLAQVVTNLLSNAIKFSPPDGEVAVAVRKRGRLVRISVRDHGPGISAGFKPHMFEKFAQADATDARRKGGTGLGLSIVKQIVTRLGGTVDFEDAPSGGTVFYVDLASRDQVAEREIDPTQQPSAGRILLCADDPHAAIVVREGLAHFGFATDLAYTRADAIARATAAPYGAIVADLELPDGESIGLVRDLRNRARNRRIPIIGMSADPRRDIDTPPSWAPDDWLNKPLDIDRLAQSLDRIMLRKSLERPHILHVDADPEVLGVVAHALGTAADVMSVNSIEDARRALSTQRFDLAVLDFELRPGLDLLPELRGSGDDAIPVIIFSTHGDGPVGDPQVQADPSKSRAALDSLVTTVKDRLRERSTRASTEIA